MFSQSLLYIKVTCLSYIYVQFLFLTLTSITFHHEWLDIVFCAIQQDLIAYPLQMWKFVSIDPRLPIHPTPSPSSLATKSLFSKSMSFFSVGSFICALDYRYKWYHMVFVFLFLNYFILYESLIPSMLLQMPLFFSFLWLSSIPLCVYIPYLFNPFICISDTPKFWETLN